MKAICILSTLILIPFLALAKPQPLKCKNPPRPAKMEEHSLMCGPGAPGLEDQLQDFAKVGDVVKNDVSDELVQAFWEAGRFEEVRIETQLRGRIGYKEAHEEKVIQHYDKLKAFFNKEVVPSIERLKEDIDLLLEQEPGSKGHQEAEARSAKSGQELSNKAAEMIQLAGIPLKPGDVGDANMALFFGAKLLNAKTQDQYKKNAETEMQEMRQAYQSLRILKNPKGKSEQELLKEKHIFIRYQMNKALQEMKSEPAYQDCGLSLAESYAIYWYTASGFSDLNATLRTRRQNESGYRRIQALENTLNSALSKLASYEGLVKRGTFLNATALEAHCLGCEVRMDAFTSTSLRRGFTQPHKFIIKSKTGVYIAPMSQSVHEEEVLFKSNTKFKVLQVKGSEFTLEEIEEEDPAP